MKQPPKTSRDDPNSSKNIIPGVINKHIPLADAKDDREVALAGMSAALYEAYPPGVTIPDEFHLCIDGQLRNRNQRPGAHCVVKVDATEKRRTTVNATTKPIDE